MPTWKIDLVKLRWYNFYEIINAFDKNYQATRVWQLSKMDPKSQPAMQIGNITNGYFYFIAISWDWFYIYLYFHRPEDKNNSVSADKFDCWFNEWLRKAGSINEGKIQYGSICIYYQRIIY